MKAVVFAGALLALPATASAMSVEEFLTKASALKARGVSAMFSSDLKVVTNEVKMAGSAYRVDVDAARAKGRTDLGCPPPKGKARLSSDELIGAMSAVPPAQRGSTSVKAAFYRMMANRFPCR